MQVTYYQQLIGLIIKRISYTISSYPKKHRDKVTTGAITPQIFPASPLFFSTRMHTLFTGDAYCSVSFCLRLRDIAGFIGFGKNAPPGTS